MKKQKQYIVKVSYETQDGRNSIMVSKPVTKRKANKEVSRLSLLGHKVGIYEATN